MLVLSVANILFYVAFYILSDHWHNRPLIRNVTVLGMADARMATMTTMTYNADTSKVLTHGQDVKFRSTPRLACISPQAATAITSIASIPSPILSTTFGGDVANLTQRKPRSVNRQMYAGKKNVETLPDGKLRNWSRSASERLERTDTKLGLSLEAQNTTKF